MRHVLADPQEPHLEADQVQDTDNVHLFYEPLHRAGWSPAHVTFSVFIGADAEDMVDILERCPGMPAVVAETTIRGVQAAVITGTLAQWREAVNAGSSPKVAATVRHGFNRIHDQFCAQGLNVWGEFNTRPAPDQTFYLEDRRGR